MMLIFPVMFGVTQGLMPTVGFNFGARQYGRMWRAVRLAATSTGLLGTVLAAVLWIYARQVVYVFSKDPELERLTVLSLRLVLLTLWTAAPQMMAVSALQGMGMGPQAMLLSLARQLFFLVPGTILLSHFFGVAGAFAAMPVADVLSGTVTGIYVYKVWRRYREPELTLAPSPTP